MRAGLHDSTADHPMKIVKFKGTDPLGPFALVGCNGFHDASRSEALASESIIGDMKLLLHSLVISRRLEAPVEFS
jgi:hypothetical protein